MAWTVKAIVAGIMLAAAVPIVAQDASAPATDDNWEGLARVQSDKIELVYLLPGADFRPYTKVILDPPEMAMKANWLRDQRRSSSTLGSQATERDITRALTDGREEFEKRLTRALTEAGFTIVTSPGEDVLRLRSGVVDIDVVAPDVSAQRTRNFSEEAGAATLVIEVRDSVTNALLGRAIERRVAGDNGPFLRTSVSNRADFDQLFQRWARAAANGLAELKALSPVDVNSSRLAR